MSNKTLAVKETAAIKAYNEADYNGKKMLVNLYGEEVFNMDITDRINTIEELFAWLGEDMDDVIGVNDDKQDRANKIAKRIAKAYNEGEVMDFSNPNQKKYYPWMVFVPGSGFSLDSVDYVTSHTYVGAALCFKDEKLVRKAVAKFPDVYNDLFS